MATRIGPVLAVIGSDVKGFTDGLSKSQKSLQQFSATASIAGVRASAAFAATFGAIAALSTKVGAEFELAFANVKKTVEGTPETFQALEESIRDTSKTFGIAATEIADLARIGGQLGIAAEDLDDFTKTIAKLSIAAAELDPESAARGLARLAALTKEGSGSIEKMANVLAKLGDTLPTTEGRILDFSTRVASFGSAVGLSSEEILGLSAGFSALVGGTERAATAVERFLGEMASAVASGGTELEAFADLAAMAMDSPIQGIEDFAAAFEGDPIEAITLVLGGMETLSEDGLAPLLQKFDELGISGVRMLSTFAASAKGMDVLRLSMATASKEAIEQAKLQKELAIQLDTVSRQFDILKDSLIDVGIELFQAFRDEIMLFIAAGKLAVAGLLKIAEAIKSMGTVVQFGIIAVGLLAGGFALLLVAIGTLGGLVVGLSSLMTSLVGALTGTAIAAKLASLGLVTFSASTGTATVATGAFTLVLGAAKAAMISFVLPVLAIVAAAAVLAEVFSELSINSQNLSPKLSDAADELGFFAGIAETAKIATEAVSDAWAAGAAEADLLAKAEVELNEETGETGKQFDTFGGILIRFAGEFARTATGAHALTAAYVQLRANTLVTERDTQALREQMAAQAAAAFIAARDNITLGEAFAKMREDADKAKDRVKELAEENEKIAESAELAAKSMELQIAGFIKAAAEGDRLSDVAKGLGIDEDVLAKIVADAGEGYLVLAETQIAAKDAADKLTESIKKQKEAFEGLSVDALAAEFGILGTALEQALAGGAEFSPDALLSIFEDLATAAAAAGEEIGPDLIGNLLEGLDTSLIKTSDQAKTFVDAMKAIAKESGQAFSDELISSIQPDVFSQAIVAAGLAEAQAVQTAAASAKAFVQASKDVERTLELVAAGFELAQGDAAALAEAEDVLSRASSIAGKEITSAATAQAILTVAQERGLMGAENLEQAYSLLANGTLPETESAISKVDLGLEKLNEAQKEADDRAKDVRESTQALAAAFELLGISSDSAAGKMLGAFQAASLAAAELGKSKAKLDEVLGPGGAGLDSSEGISAGIAFGSNLLSGAVGVWEAGAGDGMAGAIGGAVAGAQFGAEIGEMFGPIGAVAGAAIGAGIGLALSLFRGKPEFVKIMQDIGKAWGVEVSEELAKEIEATADRLDLGRMEATLLSLGDVMAEAGGAIEFGLDNATVAVNDLMNAIATGAVPAAEGIEELGTVFTQMASELFTAGTVADAALLQLIERSRELGIEVPEIAAFIVDQLAQAAAGITQVIGQAMENEDTGETTFGGIQVASLEDAQAQATIFAAGFFATLSEVGLREAVDTFGPAFEEMKQKLEAFGSDVNFGGVERLFKVAQDPKFGPLLDGLQGLKDGMTGLGNAGFLTAETFGAFQQQGVAAFDQMVELGLSSKESLQQMAPFLQEAINASQTFGFTLDEDTQKLIDQAEAAGIGFATDPMTAMVDVLKLIAEQLGVTQEALGGIGETAAAAGDEVEESLGGEVPEKLREEWGLTEESVRESYRGMADGAQQAADEMAASATESATEAVVATEEAAEQVELKWAENTIAVGTKFDEMTDMILTDYQIVIDSTLIAGEAVAGLGENAISAASGFDQMAEAARKAAAAAGSAGNANGGPPSEKGQFGLTTTVNEPTTFIAGEAGEETVTIDPGGGGAPGGAPSVVVLQIDGKTIGKVLGDLSRTGDVRIHPSAVKDFG